MVMRRIIFVLSLLFVSSALAQEATDAPPAFDTAAPNAILVDGKSGEVFFEKSADAAIPPASI